MNAARVEQYIFIPKVISRHEIKISLSIDFRFFFFFLFFFQIMYNVRSRYFVMQYTDILLQFPANFFVSFSQFPTGNCFRFPAKICCSPEIRVVSFRSQKQYCGNNELKQQNILLPFVLLSLSAEHREQSFQEKESLKEGQIPQPIIERNLYDPPN